MRINNCEQKSPEWWTEKVGKVSGTRFGQAISTRANRLQYDMLSESLMGIIIEDDYISEDMQFGIDNEPVARKLYSEQSGIDFREVGLIYSDFSDIHLASPDGLSSDNSIALEIKCTQNGGIHAQRFFEGVESAYMGQILNYFACSDEIREVHFVSYCPSLKQRPLVIKIFTADTFRQDIIKGRFKIIELDQQLKINKHKFIF